MIVQPARRWTPVTGRIIDTAPNTTPCAGCAFIETCRARVGNGLEPLPCWAESEEYQHYLAYYPGRQNGSSWVMEYGKELVR